MEIWSRNLFCLFEMKHEEIRENPLKLSLLFDFTALTKMHTAWKILGSYYMQPISICEMFLWKKVYIYEIFYN